MNKTNIPKAKKQNKKMNSFNQNNMLYARMKEALRNKNKNSYLKKWEEKKLITDAFVSNKRQMVWQYWYFLLFFKNGKLTTYLKSVLEISFIIYHNIWTFSWKKRTQHKTINKHTAFRSCQRTNNKLQIDRRQFLRVREKKTYLYMSVDKAKK